MLYHIYVGDLMKWFENKIKKMGMWDISSLKLSCMFFGLFVAAYIPLYVDVYRWYIFALFILFALKPAFKVLKK